MGPFIDTLAATHADNPKIQVLKMDVDENPVTSETYRVLSIPTFAVFTHGKPVAGISGVTTVQKLQEMIDKALATPDSIAA
jgi:thioredoxin 1